MVEEIILFKNIYFQYPGVRTEVLSNCSFSIKKGERVTIKGESETGKTTLLRLLLGFEKPDKGEILFRDNPLDTTSIKQLRRETIWLPQDLNLGNGTLQDVFYYPFKFEANTAQTLDEDTIFQVLKSLGLKEDLWKTDFSDLSTGQRQRAGIALCHHLLDKPLPYLCTE